MKSQDFTKKAFKVLWKSPRFHQTKLPQKVGTKWHPQLATPIFQPTKKKATVKIFPTLQAFQAFQVTSQEPKLRYNQLDTPAMTKRKRCHSVVFIVKLGPSAPFTNHKSSTQRVQRCFRHVFFSWNNSINVMEGVLPSNLNIRTCSPRIIPKSRKYQEVVFSFLSGGWGGGGRSNTKKILILYINIYIYIYIICTVKPSQGKDEGRNDKCNEDFSQTQIVCHTDAFSAVEKELCLFQESEENWVCAPQFLISRIVGRRLLMCSFADLKKSPVKFGCVQGCRNSWNKSVK